MLYLVLVLAICLQAASRLDAQTEPDFYVVPAEATQLCQFYPNGTCFTLDELSSSINNNCPHCNLTVSFLPGNHSLSIQFTIKNAQYVAFRSEFPLAARPLIRCVNTTSASAGFRFVTIDTVRISVA